MSWLPSGMDLGAGLWSMAEMEFQQESNEKNRQFEKDMSEEEYRRAVEMWNMTNTYNSPAEQRKRLEAAGLNPALMYGKAASPGIAGPAPTWNAPKSGHFGGNFAFSDKSYVPDIQGVLNAYNDLRRTNADVDKTIEETRGESLQNDILWYLKMLYEPDTGGANENAPMYRRLMADIKKSEASATKEEAEANLAQRRWNVYSTQGYDIFQMSNAGKYLEEKYGKAAGVIFDALFGKGLIKK